MSSAYLALLCSCALVLLASWRAVPSSSRRGLAYWWVLFGFGYAGVIQVLSLDIGFGTANTAALIEFGPAMIIGASLFASSLLREGYLGTSGLALAAFGVLSMAFVITRDADLMPMIAFAAVLPAISVRNDIELSALRLGIVDSMRLTVVALIALALIVPSATLGQCRLDKCSVFGQQLGQTGDANALGMAVAATGVIAAASLERRWLAVPFLAGVYGIVDLSSSRSALLPLAFGATAIVAAGFLRGRLVSLITAAAALSVVGAQLYVATGTWTRDAFTGRGALWDRAQSLILQSPLWGYGPSFWVRQNATNAIAANYSTHNLILELLISTGILGLALVSTAVVTALRNRKRADRGVLAVAVIAWLAGGVTEVMAAPGRLYLFPAVFPFIFVLARAQADQRGDDRSQNRVEVDDVEPGARPYGLAAPDAPQQPASEGPSVRRLASPP